MNRRLKGVQPVTIFALWGVFLIAICSGCDREKNENLSTESMVGLNIYDVSDGLKQEGLKVSEIDDPTGEGYLFMSVQIDKITKLDSFFYALGSDPRPWTKDKPSHLWIEADTNGLIYKVQAK